MAVKFSEALSAATRPSSSSLMLHLPVILTFNTHSLDCYFSGVFCGGSVRKTKAHFSQHRQEKSQELNKHSTTTSPDIPALIIYCHTSWEPWVSHAVLMPRHPSTLLLCHRVSISHPYMISAGNWWGTTSCESSQG